MELKKYPTRAEKNLSFIISAFKIFPIYEIANRVGSVSLLMNGCVFLSIPSVCISVLGFLICCLVWLPRATDLVSA